MHGVIMKKALIPESLAIRYSIRVFNEPGDTQVLPDDGTDITVKIDDLTALKYKTWAHLSPMMRIKGLKWAEGGVQVGVSDISVIPEGVRYPEPLDSAEITKIHPAKMSLKKDTAYTRVEFKLQDGSWAKSDICHNFRNYPRWQRLISKGVGTKIYGVRIAKGIMPQTIDADSPVALL
jgi:hypothetical protein